MHYGVYVGAAAMEQPKRVLILGESHHGDGGEKPGEPGRLSTRQVVADYLSRIGAVEARLQFFHKIALAFGMDVGKQEEKAQFWEKVFFGNYVDELCGVKDRAAEKAMKANWKTYNRELAEFVNQYQIEYIFCMGLGVFDYLPGDHEAGILLDGNGNRIADKVLGKNCNGRVTLSGYRCEPLTSLFDHAVYIYGIPHPGSWYGFPPARIAAELKPVFERCCRQRQASTM